MSDVLLAIVLAIVFAAFFAWLVLYLQARAARPYIEQANAALDGVDLIIKRNSPGSVDEPDEF